jgi:hypothetical protein
MKSILLTLDNQNIKIISKDRLFNILLPIIKKDSFENILRKLKRQNKIKYLFNNYFYILDSNEQTNQYFNYSVLEMIATILNKQKIKWHFGLHSSSSFINLNYSSFKDNSSKIKYNTQVYNKIIIINNKYSKKIKLLDHNLIFKKQSIYSFIGIKKIKSNNRVTFNFSDLERTYLDYIYFHLHPDIDKDNLNKKTLREHKNLFPKINYE